MTTAAEKKTTAAAKTAEALPDVASCLSLRQKLVEMRKACPEILKKKHSDGVSYSYAKIYDVWEKITPIMNQLGVDFDVIAETATKHSDNGDPLYWITMQTKTRNGDKLMFLYEADLTIRWTNLDNEDETIEAVIHSIGWNDDPAKAKGAAHTYALKYYLSRNSRSTKARTTPTTTTSAHRARAPAAQEPPDRASSVKDRARAPADSATRNSAASTRRQRPPA